VPPSVDVVIVAYNRYDLTESCLRHLAAQTIEHRVIVIDNGSTDETFERIAANWPAVALRRLPENHGFADACNRGVAAGSGEIVVLLNNDVDARPDFLARLVGPLADNPRLGSVAALMLQPGDEQLIDSAGLTADAVLGSFPRLQGLAAAEARRERPLLVGPAGTAAAYRRAAWDQVGGLDDAIGVHLGSATHGHRSARQRRNGGFGRGYMIRRYGLLHGRDGPRALATELVVVLADLAISRDLQALRGRWEGWRAARRMAPRRRPPAEAIDTTIGFRDSLAMRRGVYARRSA
jgi:N-acetylglucosaminyl-diphospho-decaprenol L-rhamnosyltransferase